MKKTKITKSNINSFLKTKRGNKYYFKFPGIEKSLVVETGGAGSFWPEEMIICNGKLKLDVEAMRKEEVFRRAFSAYRSKYERQNRN